MAGRPGRCTRRSIEYCRGALKSTTYNEDEDDDDEEENAHDDDALQTHDDAAARAPYKEDAMVHVAGDQGALCEYTCTRVYTCMCTYFSTRVVRTCTITGVLLHIDSTWDQTNTKSRLAMY